MLSPVSCRKRGWDVSHFSLAAQSLLPGTPAASLQTRGRAQPTLSPMLSEPGWIPPGGAGTGTQEESGTASCQRWHFQAGTARGDWGPQGMATLCSALLSLEIDRRRKRCLRAFPAQKSWHQHQKQVAPGKQSCDQETGNVTKALPMSFGGLLGPWSFCDSKNFPSYCLL